MVFYTTEENKSKEENSSLFSKNGEILGSGGFDRRIRIQRVEN
jgi:hypothetical protein